MRFVCLDPIAKSSSVCSVSVYNESFEFLYQKICKKENTDFESYFHEESTIVCFDIFKTFDYFGRVDKNIYDVRNIYKLLGYNFKNLIELSDNILGAPKTEKMKKLSREIRAHIRSYEHCKININDYSQEQIIPSDLIETFYRERSHIVMALFSKINFENAKFYNKMFTISRTLHEISSQGLDIDMSALKSTMYSKYFQKNKINLKFDIVGAKTGRVGFKNGTFNVYILPKQFRNCIVAGENSKIVQFDYQSFQPRIATALTNDEEFKERILLSDDIYQNFSGDREKNKIAFLAWMFSPKNFGKFNKEAKPIKDLKEKVVKEANLHGKIQNIFERELFFQNEQPHIVFQNFITSNEADTILNVMHWVHKALNRRKSRVLFPYHDAIVCEIHDDEQEFVKKIKTFMEEWPKQYFGVNFPVSVKTGKTFL